jgi:hypothetical protein
LCRTSSSTCSQFPGRIKRYSRHRHQRCRRHTPPIQRPLHLHRCLSSSLRLLPCKRNHTRPCTTASTHHLSLHCRRRKSRSQPSFRLRIPPCTLTLVMGIRMSHWSTRTPPPPHTWSCTRLRPPCCRRRIALLPQPSRLHRLSSSTPPSQLPSHMQQPRPLSPRTQPSAQKWLYDTPAPAYMSSHKAPLTDLRWRSPLLLLLASSCNRIQRRKSPSIRHPRPCSRRHTALTRSALHPHIPPSSPNVRMPSSPRNCSRSPRCT